MNPSRGSWLLGLALAGALASASARAESQPGEYQVKAAFLVHFAGLVVWPPEAFGAPDSPLRISVFGSDALADALAETLVGRHLDAHPLELERAADVSAARHAHIVFVGRGEAGSESQLLSLLRGSSVLSVGETPGFAERGGVVNFFETDSKIHFEINPRAAERARLRISSRLLGLARIVEERAE